MEDEKDHRELDGYKAQAKKLLKTMSNGTPARVSVESGGSVFQCARASDTPQPVAHLPNQARHAPACRSYINQEGVCYMCLTEKSYPKRCAPGSCTAALAHPTHPAASAPLSRDVAASEATAPPEARWIPAEAEMRCVRWLHPQHTPTAPLGTPLARVRCRLAFNYLEELLKEFSSRFRDDVDTASRPYAFIKFGAPAAATRAAHTLSPSPCPTPPPPARQTPSSRGPRSSTSTRAPNVTSTSLTTCATRLAAPTSLATPPA